MEGCVARQAGKRVLPARAVNQECRDLRHSRRDVADGNLVVGDGAAARGGSRPGQVGGAVGRAEVRRLEAHGPGGERDRQRHGQRHRAGVVFGYPFTGRG